nr:MAG TPA: hypothetical protein [Caudoviricetes sp.]
MIVHNILQIHLVTGFVSRLNDTNCNSGNMRHLVLFFTF